MPPDHVHLNGSVNLADAESVMREVAARLPSGLRRMPDGETGDRDTWIDFQLQKFLPDLRRPARAGRDPGRCPVPGGIPDAARRHRHLHRPRPAAGAASLLRAGVVRRPGPAARRDPARRGGGAVGCRGGDYGHQHFKQPESLALQVRVLNAVIAAAGRPVSFVSFTVPQNQREEGYFAPLAQLAAGPATELNFALVPYHPAGQAPGTTEAQVRLIDAALAASAGGRRGWGVCTECGMGRAARDEIPALLDLHRQIAVAS